MEELKLEESKLKKSQRIITVIACLAAGVALYAIYKHNVSFIHWALPLGSAMYLGKIAEDVKAIQKEMNNKKF